VEVRTIPRNAHVLVFSVTLLPLSSTSCLSSIAPALNKWGKARLVIIVVERYPHHVISNTSDILLLKPEVV
jgi:hypothetical protein